MKTVLIAAYAISPTKGSEYGVGWNFVRKISQYYKVVVLYGSSGNSIGDTAELETYIKENNLPNIEFKRVAPNRVIKFFDKINHLGFPLSYYIAYRLWQKEVLIEAKKMLINRNDIVLVHQLNSIGFSSPGYLWKLDVPFIWGPVGGTYILPKSLMDVFPFTTKLRYLLRNWNINYTLKHAGILKKVVEKAAGIFVSTHVDKEQFKSFLGVDVTVIPENNINSIKLGIPENDISHPIRLIWTGSLDGRKALFLLIEALKGLDKDLWQLDVIGQGPLASDLYQLAENHGINDRIEWHGLLSRAEVLKINSAADLHILTSVIDSNPTVLLESLENGIPTIALDYSGMSTTIRDDQGRKIKAKTIQGIIVELREVLNDLFTNPFKIREMKKNIVEYNEHPTWEKAIAKVLEIYSNAQESRNGKN